MFESTGSRLANLKKKFFKINHQHFSDLTNSVGQFEAADTHRVRVVLFELIEQAALFGVSELDAKDIVILFATRKCDCKADEEKLNEPHSGGFGGFQGITAKQICSTSRFASSTELLAEMIFPDEITADPNLISPTSIKQIFFSVRSFFSS